MSASAAVRNHTARIRVLRAAREQMLATVILEWPEDDSAAWLWLLRGGYVRCRAPGAGRRGEHLDLTPQGVVYLEQLEAALKPIGSS